MSCSRPWTPQRTSIGGKQPAPGRAQNTRPFLLAYVATMGDLLSAYTRDLPRDYKPELERKLKQKEEKERNRQEKHLARLEKDLLETKGQKVVLDGTRARQPGGNDDGGNISSPSLLFESHIRCQQALTARAISRTAKEQSTKRNSMRTKPRSTRRSCGRCAKTSDFLRHTNLGLLRITTALGHSTRGAITKLFTPCGKQGGMSLNHRQRFLNYSHSNFSVI
jgi:hypothetical protein